MKPGAYMQVSCRGADDGPWVRIYVCAAGDEPEEGKGREVARYHKELLNDDAEFRSAVVEFCHAIGRSAHKKLGLPAPTEFDVGGSGAPS